MSAFLERLRSPARKASSGAGPPERYVIAGFVLSGAILLIGWWTGALDDVPWPLWAVVPVTLQTVIAIADRDGWNIRRAMAYVASQQRARWTSGPIPRTPTLAQAWLDDPAHIGAHPLERVSMLLATGNLAAAKTKVDAYVPETDAQKTAVARIRSHIGALETGSLDIAPILAAAAPLGEDERRYQLTAASWAQAWLDIEGGRPWRPRFADAIRDLGPYEVPRRILAYIGAQQLAAPIATVFAIAIMAVVLG